MTRKKRWSGIFGDMTLVVFLVSVLVGGTLLAIGEDAGIWWLQTAGFVAMGIFVLSVVDLLWFGWKSSSKSRSR